MGVFRQTDFHLRFRMGVLGRNFPSNYELGARLEVVRGSWKGLQNPFPANVQTDVRLGMFNQQWEGSISR